MDCNNWIGCQEDCENCILINMDQADAVQAWDVETMQQWSPEDILKLLQSIKAENERLREALEAATKSLESISENAGKDPYLIDFLQTRGYAHSRARMARAALRGEGE